MFCLWWMTGELTSGTSIKSWNQLVNCETMKIFNVALVQTRHSKVQVNRANPPASSPSEYYTRAIYLPLVDSITVDLVMKRLTSWVNFPAWCQLPSYRQMDTSHESVGVAAHLMRMYSTLSNGESKSICQLKLNSKINLWKQKWVCHRTEKPTESRPKPETVAEGLSGAFPLGHQFLTSSSRYL